MKRLFTVLLSTIFVQTVLGQYEVKFILTLPNEDKRQGEKFYLSLEQNNWKTGDTAYLFKKKDGQYSLSFKYDGKYFIQYKVNRGTDKSYESNAHGFGIPNRLLQVLSDTSVTIDVNGWSDLIEKKHTASKNIRVLDSIYIPSLKVKKQISIYLPPDYQKSQKRYPVIYMNDGDVLFDKAITDNGEAWEIDEVLDSLNKKKQAEFIVVGISAGANRFAEYSPYKTKQLNMPLGDIYLTYIINNLIPYINKHFRTKPGAENTSIGGSSMGGLISYYATIKYPDIFGSAAVFSPAYWNSSVDSLISDSKKQLNNLHSKIFFYGGAAEGIIELPKVLNDINDILAQNKNIKTTVLISEGGRHEESYWTEPFKEFVLWLQKK